EDVRVSAGTFKAFRIDVQILPQSCGNANVNLGLPTLQLWYAPEPRRLVKVQGVLLPSEVSFELAGRPVDTASAPARPIAVTPPATRPVVPADTQPPRIALSYPAGDATVNHAQLVVAGTVTDDTGVTRVQI